MTALKIMIFITNVFDYAVPSKNYLKIKQVTYEKLKSDSIDINNKTIPTNFLFGFKKTKKIVEEFKI